MQKIPTLFQRDFAGKTTKKDFNAIDVVTEGCEWVQAGEGVATQKHDGSACLIHDGNLYKRHRVKEGNTVPPGWMHWSLSEQHSGHGWLPVEDGLEDQYHREAWVLWEREIEPEDRVDGTYELCGPKVQGNPEGFENHGLIKHGSVKFPNAPTGFNELKDWLNALDIEGLVWHHPDGRMAKIKKSDFGLKR